MRRLLAVTALVTGMALLAPLAPASAVSPTAGSLPARDTAPPNDRDPGGDGQAPWLSKAGRDMKGYRPSTYTGKYYEKSREQYRLCVVQRESGGNYDEPSAGHQGAYQMSPSLAEQALGAMRAEIRSEYGAKGTAALKKLEGVPIYKWARFWQDAAFWTIFDHGNGWRHWSSEWGANWDCDHRPNAEKGWPNPDLPNYTPLEGNGRRTAAARVAENVGTAKCCRPEVSMKMARVYIRRTYGWGSEHYVALKQMWWRESNWQYDVINNHPNGPWYGLGQVNGPYIEAQGYSIDEYMESPRKQIIVGTKYIKERYGTPVKAWAFWQDNGWY